MGVEGFEKDLPNRAKPNIRVVVLWFSNSTLGAAKQWMEANLVAYASREHPTYDRGMGPSLGDDGNESNPEIYNMRTQVQFVFGTKWIDGWNSNLGGECKRRSALLRQPKKMQMPCHEQLTWYAWTVGLHFSFFCNESFIGIVLVSTKPVTLVSSCSKSSID
jgi:hypothetical protein